MQNLLHNMLTRINTHFRALIANLRNKNETSSISVTRVSTINKMFLEGLITYFPLIWHAPHWKRRFQQCFVAAATFLPSCYLATIGGYTDRRSDSPLISHGPHSKWRVQQFFYCSVHRYRGNVFTELLPSTGINLTQPLPCNDTATHNDGRDLWSTPLRWVQVSWYTYQVS
jgi:hypothetical protein